MGYQTGKPLFSSSHCCNSTKNMKYENPRISGDRPSLLECQYKFPYPKTLQCGGLLNLKYILPHLFRPLLIFISRITSYPVRSFYSDWDLGNNEELSLLPLSPFVFYHFLAIFSSPFHRLLAIQMAAHIKITHVH